MAVEEHRDPLAAEPDAATAHDGDVEPDADKAGPAEPASEPGAGTVLEAIEQARDELSNLLGELASEEPDVERADALLDSAHLAIVACLDGPKCPMCQGDGLLALEPAADPRAERCEDCGGQGKVYTGSLVPESAVRPCGKCGGKGFNDLAGVIDLPRTDYSPPPVVEGAQWYDANDAGTWHLPVNPAQRGQTIGS